MNKDLSFLKNNKLFLWLCSCLPIAAIGVMQYFFYGAYTTWVFWQIMLIAVLSGLCVCAYSVWLAVNVLPKVTVKSFIIFGVIFTALTCFFYFGASAIDLAVKKNNLSAFILGAVSTDLILVFSFIFGWSSQGSKNFKGALSATGALLCALIVVLSVFVSTLPKNDSMIDVKDKFSVMDTLPRLTESKKVKVILINGQSNASGVSRVSCLTEEQKAYYGAGFENVLINYFCDNGNNSSHGAFVSAGLNQGYADGFFGPELGLAEELSKVTGENFIILKYTWGGTVLDTQWFPPRSDGSVGPLYTAFINFTGTYMEYLRAKGYDAEIGAMCWMQGESDSVMEEWTQNYYQNTVDFVASLRKDLSNYAAKDGGIRYIDAGISDSKYWERYQRVNGAKQQYANNPEHNAVYIDTIAAGLDFTQEPTPDNPDLAHYDAASELLLGKMFAQKVLERYGIAQ